MRKIKVFIAMSLDGYIATEDDSVAFLEAVEGLGDNGYKKFYNTVDALIMGRMTYDWIMEHVEEYPYKGKLSYVLTSRQRSDLSNVKFIQSLAEIKEIQAQKAKDIWVVGGGALVQSLLNENMIDDMIITIAPVLLGGGIPLFKNNTGDFELTELKRFEQFTQLHYIKRR